MKAITRHVFKTHMTLLSGLLACSIMLQAQAVQAPVPKESPKDEKCSIEGRVLGSTTEQPLARATLTLAGGPATTRA